ncbi:unnamed protein product [Bursaphelenchus okinawaensis]|uniref:Presenilin n=1 Tax=Bursaphelenchus okinawaensis TaxID=465554 RepID=A0A811LHB7_9BILA|nr:unnamed protein product [Bursaphelenchus okinawaensis]CAG9125323.1 unnamed protein product [Bursaphelenchus okinawaensis]
MPKKYTCKFEKGIMGDSGVQNSRIEFSGLSEANESGPSTSRTARKDSDDSHICELKHGASQVIDLFIPVSLCMLAVILSMRSIGYFTRPDGVYMIYTPFTKPTESAGELFIMSIGNALTLLGVVMVMTCGLYLLYKHRFYRVIHGWLCLSTVMLLGFFSSMYFEELLKNFNVGVDYLTFLLIVWNFAAVGIICVHWKGPFRMQQGYLIIMSALMALVFIKHLPEWSVWTVLAALAIWDLVAVLCPLGPLRALVETAQERNEPIFPALIYSSTMMYMASVSAPTFFLGLSGEDNGNQPSSVDVPQNIQPLTDRGQRIAPLRGQQQSTPPRPQENTQQRPQQNTSTTSQGQQRRERQEQPHYHEEEEKGVKLGLGDFIFYSVLVGKACSYGDWNTTITCYISILLGLSFTLMLLAIFRKALPALPISIFAGIVFYFATYGIITPFMTEISVRQWVV